jgi:multiple sugar transport system ATP-binding protein
MAEVSLQNVSKRFGETQAVRELSLAASDGEFIVLLGPTGAGKTTTLRLIAGLERPDVGRVTIGGTDVTRLAPAERDVCFVFQQYSLYPHYSVFDNMAFPLRAPGRRFSKTEIDARVHEVAALLRIESKLGNRATQLSGGEMQRVAIGRALVRSPAVYLMDEPLSSLDAKLREDLRVELKRIQRELGATVVYVTHDQLEAMTMADRIGVMSNGRLVQIGSPRDVYERPESIYVAQRVGSPQINLIESDVLHLPDRPSQAATIGVRPEDILLNRAGGIEAEILAVEHLGVETVLLLGIGPDRIHALLGVREPMRVGERTRIGVRDGAALYFDAAGTRIGDAQRVVRREVAYGA